MTKVYSSRGTVNHPLKVGDRVAVYGQPYCGSFDVPEMTGDRATVTLINHEGWVQVRCDNDYGVHLLFHPKQCRRLRKRSKPREVWVKIMDGGTALARTVQPYEQGSLCIPNHDYVLFREVIKRIP